MKALGAGTPERIAPDSIIFGMPARDVPFVGAEAHQRRPSDYWPGYRPRDVFAHTRFAESDLIDQLLRDRPRRDPVAAAKETLRAMGFHFR